MIAAFFHDFPIVKGNDEKYYSNGISYEFWKRYLSVFDSVIVSTRVRYESSLENLSMKKMKISSGENVHFSPISAYKKSKDIIFNRKEIRRQIVRNLEESDCAIIRLPSFIGQIACNEAVKMGKPYIIEAVGCARDSMWYHSNIGKLMALPRFIAMKKSIEKSKYTIYVTEKFLQNRYPTKGKSTNCSNVSLVDLNKNLLNKRIEKIKNEERNKEKKMIIGTTGDLDVRYKGQESVIKALGKLKSEGNTDFEYQLVGGGKSTYLKQVAEQYDVMEQVSFLGIKTHEEVLDWLDIIDVYIQPSKTEGLPRGLIEAMSRGVLSAGSNAGGIPELLDTKFVFKKSRNNEAEIAFILASIKPRDLIEQAKQNFRLTQNYKEQVINFRRQAFLREFVNGN